MANCAFVGLGVMGYSMAGHLAASGHNVSVFNRTSVVAERWVAEYQGTAAATPAQVVKDAEYIFICVGNDDDVRSVVYGEQGVLAGAAPQSLLVDHTTASAQLARELYDAAQAQQIHFLDAPVSGGQQGAENGTLTVMVGGDPIAFTDVEPIMQSYARSVKLLGEAGAGQLCKMANQICIAGVVQGLSEAIHFSKQAGLDATAVIDVISKGAAQSWQMDNRHQTMIAGEYEHGFAVDWMRKDLGIVLSEASDNGASLPLTALVDQFYNDVQRMGGGRYDTSSLLARLEQYETK